jgi:hypothetical protein
MDMLKKLSLGAQVTLGAGVLFLIFSFLNWFEVKHTSYGESMWHGIGVVAGLLLLAVLIWEGLRVAGAKIEVGISHSMIGAGLAVLLLLFTFIRFIDKPGGGIADSIIDRTVWAWLGLILAIVVVVGAWLGMQAAGESMADVKATLSSMTSSASSTSTEPAAAAPAPPAPPPAEPATAPSEPTPPPAGDEPAAT